MANSECSRSPAPIPARRTNRLCTGRSRGRRAHQRAQPGHRVPPVLPALRAAGRPCAGASRRDWDGLDSVTSGSSRSRDRSKGQFQDGSSTSIDFSAFTEGVVSPRDPASGLPTGKRSHKPLTITKQIDAASPLLYNACVTNENLTAGRDQPRRAWRHNARDENHVDERLVCRPRARWPDRDGLIHVPEDHVDVHQRRHHG